MQNTPLVSKIIALLSIYLCAAILLPTVGFSQGPSSEAAVVMTSSKAETPQGEDLVNSVEFMMVDKGMLDPGILTTAYHPQNTQSDAGLDEVVDQVMRDIERTDAPYEPAISENGNNGQNGNFSSDNGTFVLSSL